MHEILKNLEDKILELALASLAQANTHAVFHDPLSRNWDELSILNAAHAGELFLKALIAKEHPLLIFKDVFVFDDARSSELSLDQILLKGRSHDFEKLPQVLWVTTGIRIPNKKCFDEIRLVRNSIQHFCGPVDRTRLRVLALEFIYTVLDPLLRDHFGIFAIEYHQDHCIGYDYIVLCLMRLEIQFSIPDNFCIGEFQLSEELKNLSPAYRKWFESEMNKLGRDDLLS